MYLKPHGLGLAAAFVTALSYVLCTGLYALAPNFFWRASKFALHYDFSSLGAAVTWATFLGGLVLWVVLAYVGGALFAWFYNQAAK